MNVICKPLIIECIREAKKNAQRTVREIDHITLTQHEYSLLCRQSHDQIKQRGNIPIESYGGTVDGIDIYVEPEINTENKNNDS